MLHIKKDFMKTFIHKNLLATLLLVGAVGAFTSCSNIVTYDEDYTPAHDRKNTGTPVILAIYDVHDTAEAHPLTEGRVDMMIRIVGQNLNNVKSIRFVTADPDLSGLADLEQAYTASTSANVVIPASIGQKVSRLEYTTDMGTVSFPFTVDFPQLEVLSSQYMQQGERLTLYGRYFDKYKSVQAYADELELEVLEKTENTLAVQLLTSQTSSVSLRWMDGDGQPQQATIPLRPMENLLYDDFSGTQISNDGINYTLEDDTAVPSAAAQGRKHLHLQAELDAWAWKTLDLSQNIPFAVGEPSDYVLTFEVLTPEDAPFISSEKGSELLLFQFNWDNMMGWAPGQGAGLNTHGQWMTVSLPLDGMNLSKKDSWQTLRMVLHPNASFHVDFRLANFRILRK